MKKFLRIIFGRSTIIFVLLGIQVLLLFEIFIRFNEYLTSYAAYGGITLLTAFTLAYIINLRSNSNFKISWLVLIALLPFFGLAFYIFTKLELGTRIAKRELIRISEKTQKLLIQDEETQQQIAEKNKDVLRISNYMNNTSGYPIYKDTETQYYPTGEQAFDAMLEELEKAEKFIFMEFFIVKEGYMLSEIEKILFKKAKEGVEVRFMYDGMVSLYHEDKDYISYLKENGIQARQFLPIRPFLSTVYNNRDHRKILVVDGKVGFTGGINIADEYINKIERFGHWKDNALKIKGEAVKSFTLMFLQMWSFDDEEQDYKKYLESPSNKYQSEGFVLPYADSPLDDERVGENIYLDIISNAKEYVNIMTPYFVLDDALINSLIFAAKSGIDVRVITPHIPDKKYVYILAKTYQRELIEAGVKIYEYIPGFVHAKVFVSDDEKATVGTVNLDYRSLYLNFECGTYMYRAEVVADIKKDFSDTLKVCKEITLEDLDNVKFIDKFLGRFVLRLLAPLL